MKLKKKAILVFIVFLTVIVSLKYVEEPDIEKSQSIISITYQDVITKKEEIENKYGIKIYVLDEANYSYYGKMAEKQLDNIRAYDMLNKLENALNRYPKALIDEIKTGYAINLFPKIYLVKSIDENIYGITDKQYTDNIKLVLTDVTTIESVFHHEMMHVIDYYILFKYYPKNPFTDWKKYNPKGFEYKQGNKIDSPCFIDYYSETSILEDRATVFEYLMTHTYTSKILFKDNININKKAKYLSQMLNEYFESIKDDEIYYWNESIQ